MADERKVEGVAPTGASPRKRQRTAIAPRAAPTVVEKEVWRKEFVDDVQRIENISKRSICLI